MDTLRTLLRSRYAVGMLIPGTRDAVRPLHGEAGFDPMGRVADGRVAGHTAIPPTRRFTRADSSRAFASHAHALGMLRADSVPYATLDGICTPSGSGRWILARMPFIHMPHAPARRSREQDGAGPGSSSSGAHGHAGDPDRLPGSQRPIACGNGTPRAPPPQFRETVTHAEPGRAWGR